MPGRVLIVDDDETILEFLEISLASAGFEVASETTAAAARARVEASAFDAVLTDLHLVGTDGLELCRQLHAVAPGLPVVLITAEASVDAAVSALRAGAFDFLTKPLDPKLLAPVTMRAVEHGRLGREVDRLQRALQQTQRFGEIIGTSEVMRRVFDMIERVAGTEASVLITGESGVGKELVARSIHERGAASRGPFVALNCAAVPPSLVESELFGHVAGAFTDARNARDGLFKQADGGTLFLDEIGELPLEMQPKLLRALQERRVRPVGGQGETPFEARLVTATNRDLEAEVAAGRFREDLLYRIDVVRIELPPLRSRGRDVLLLAQSFLERFADQAKRDDLRGFDTEVAERLLSYDWPGNVRELENCVERAVALARGGTIGLDALPPKIRAFTPDRVAVDTEDPQDMPTLDQLERRYIVKVMRAVGGNKSQAAKVLGLDRRTLYRRLERHGIE